MRGTRAIAAFVALTLGSGMGMAVRAGEIRRFDFSGHAAAEAVAAAPAVEYQPGRGWGFEPGFPVTATDAGVTGAPAFFFSADVPEGNWRVTVQLVGATDGSRVTVKAELRRLLLESVVLAPGEVVTRSFIVNVRSPEFPARGDVPAGRVRLKAPRETTQEAWAWDRRLTLEFSGERPLVRTITLEPANVPTIFLLGDSTVCDQSREPYTSWGQMLTRFFGPDVAIASHAESGESYRDSWSEHRLAKVLTVLHPGDWVWLQFGHNDQKQIAAGTGGPFTTYQEEIGRYVTAIRAAGGVPVVVTPMERRRFDATGHVVPSLADYAQAAKQAATTASVTCLDLHAASIVLYEALGPERSAAAFAAPGGKIDETHHSAFGAYELARCVATLAQKQQLEFARHLSPDFVAFDPAQPDDPATFTIPASPLVTQLRPLGD